MPFEFLHKYEDLADGFGLTEEQKFDTVLRYMLRTVEYLWTTLPGYQAGYRDDYRADPEGCIV